LTVGTGVIDPFLTIQMNGTEGGFNTDFGMSGVGNPSDKLSDVTAPATYGTTGADDAKRGGGAYTSSITLGQVGTTTIGSTLYRQFFLDINETNNAADQYLSLDTLIITLGGNGKSGDYGTVDPGSSGIATVYSLTGGPVLLNYDLFNGSGKGVDLTILIKDSLFVGAATDKLNLFAQFGITGVSGTRDYGSSDGFEEFFVGSAVNCDTNPNDPACQPPPTSGGIPEPSSSGLSLMALGLLAAGFWGRRRARGT
jgi:MYXO-CTERM domain-containing protein